MIDIPTAAFDALKAGVAPYTMLELTLGSTTYRYTDAARDIDYDGNTYDAGTPLREVRNVGSAPQNGVVDLVFDDIARTWSQRFDIVGPRGNAIELTALLPYGTNQYFVTSAFKGRTLRVATIRPQGTGGIGYRLSVECADAAAVPFGVRAQWATHDFQQTLLSGAGVAADDSHSEANKARSLVWHRT